ncbi:2-polyprenyl-6-methoxyphenol hydroxylase and related FAD-dependent oxidoreductases [hydrothermal vent metagenome]|uniref:2-polyprenyl-6-methoxyphenol hydroxylase and related FAD-dependent oxidoreductases n=1 Tax=hydrothermal vent metagenome TaxID=652676 RepID=A0A3B0SF82_9ZZZZ
MNKFTNRDTYGYKISADQLNDSIATYEVIIIGAGPVGLAAAVDLAMLNIPVIILDENTNVCKGSRASCYAKRSLEILGRLGVGEEIASRGMAWKIGKVYSGLRLVNEFDLLPDDNGKYPAFTNLYQSEIETILLERLGTLRSQGRNIQIRGRNKVVGIDAQPDHTMIEIDTPDGTYEIKADWVIAADGADSDVRKLVGATFQGRTFFDHFLVCDIKCNEEFPPERRFWFDPPFNPGRSALMHKFCDGGVRIEYQLGFDTDKTEEVLPEKVISNVASLLGEDVEFELDWASVYTYQCRYLEEFCHQRVLFVGDAAHQVPPFGARGVNSGIQDVDNLCWKLKLVIDGRAPESLIDSYHTERVYAAKENYDSSTRSADFIIPKSKASAVFREAVLGLSRQAKFAKLMIDSGRQSVPCIYGNSPLHSVDAEDLPTQTRPGSVAIDVALGNEWLTDKLGGKFILLSINSEAPDSLDLDGIIVESLSLDAKPNSELSQQYLGANSGAVYLIRPDKYIAARWTDFDTQMVGDALKTAVSRQ